MRKYMEPVNFIRFLDKNSHNFIGMSVVFPTIWKAMNHIYHSSMIDYLWAA